MTIKVLPLNDDDALVTCTFGLRTIAFKATQFVAVADVATSGAMCTIVLYSGTSLDVACSAETILQALYPTDSSVEGLEEEPDTAETRKERERLRLVARERTLYRSAS